MHDQIEVVLEAFAAVEQRDGETLFALYHPEVELLEAPSLPYGGTFRGQQALRERSVHDTWRATWEPLQPTAAERRMDPRVVAASDQEVVVLWRQRGLDAAGQRFEGPVLGLYQVRDGKLARLQMFHFDTAQVVDFLDQARNHGPGSGGVPS